MPKNSNIHNVINDLRKRYFALSKDKESLLNLIIESEVSEQVYNSNAIENSTLSLDETDKVLLQIEVDRYISEREIFETKNLARVVNYINKTAIDKDLNLEMILFIHKMLISNINDDIAGRFRIKNEFVRVASHIAPSPSVVVDLLKDMLLEYKANEDQNIIKRISKLHLTFENIHPFVDGNGRIGRVINNYLLIRQGYVPINIKFIERQKYYDAFKDFDKTGSTKIMEEIVGKALTNSYYKRLAYLEGKKIIKLSEYAKINKISHSSLLNKANRQTIEAFSEKGVWKIGITH